MIRFEEALKIVLESSFSSGRETVHYLSSLGRILAAPVKSDMDMPPWDRSAVDGYACRKIDLGKPLTVAETIAAGSKPELQTEPGTCSRIMTGAPMPSGADYVFMLEEAEETEDGKVIFRGRPGKENYSKAAEDVRTGETILSPGHFIRPQHIAIMAMAGATEVTVYKKVRVGIISTGDELVEPDIAPSPAQIRNTNASQLMMQICRAGAEGRYYGIAADNEKATRELMEKALDENEVVLISGGVSEGDFDFVPATMKSMGMKILFDKVAVQPGKPLTFCTGENKIVVGMPGNPVSVFVQFEILVRPLLEKMMGAREELLTVTMPLGADFSRKRADRMAWIPVSINKDGEAVPVEYHGSAHITSLAKAWGIVAIPLGQSWIQKGELVSVRQI